MIVGISGKSRSGKTMLAQELEHLYGWKHLSLAKALKQKAKVEFGLTEAEVNGFRKEIVSRYPPLTNRQILIQLGGAYRNIDKDFWIKNLAMDSDNTNVISDVRFKNEADWIRSQGGLVIRIERAVELRGTDSNDLSETELDDYAFDCRIPESRNVDLHDISTIADQVYALAELKFALPS